MRAPLPPSAPERCDALVLAAGFGTRLHPLTRQVPKALLPIHGQPMLAWQFARLADARRIVVNAHHLAPAVRDYLDRRPDAHRYAFSYEREILGTGGALTQAASLLHGDPFVVVNADSFCEVPWSELLAFHRASGCLATMMLTRSSVWPNVVAQRERVQAILPGQRLEHGLTFTGVHVVSRALLDRIPVGGFHDIRDTYIGLIGAEKLAAFIYPPDAPGDLIDVGTPHSYLEAHRRFAAQARAAGTPATPPGAPTADDPTTSSAARIPTCAIDEASYVDPEAAIGDHCQIEVSVVLPGARIAPGRRLRWAIVGPGASVGADLDHRIVTTVGEREFRTGAETSGNGAQER